MPSRIRPGPGRIAVRKLGGEQMTASGLWIARDMRDSHVGEVVATCEPYTNDHGLKLEANYQVGDLVVIGRYTGTEVTVDRDSLIVLMERDILCTVEESPDANRQQGKSHTGAGALHLVGESSPRSESPSGIPGKPGA